MSTSSSCTKKKAVEVFVILAVAVAVVVVTAPGASARRRGDSYVDAYADSHVNKGDRDHHAYGPPPAYYGPPSPPLPLPPPHPSRYEPAAPFPDLYALPLSLLGGLLDKFHLKLNVYSLLKILLKLVIFKKIVSFIAILCLLLFIPKFKDHEDNEDDEDSRAAGRGQDRRLDRLTQLVTEAVTHRQSFT